MCLNAPRLHRRFQTNRAAVRYSAAPTPDDPSSRGRLIQSMAFFSSAV